MPDLGLNWWSSEVDVLITGACHSSIWTALIQVLTFLFDALIKLNKNCSFDLILVISAVFYIYSVYMHCAGACHLLMLIVTTY